MSDQVRRSPRLAKQPLKDEKKPSEPKPMEVEVQEDKQAILLGDLKQNIALLEKSVKQLEKRFALRVWRNMPNLRKRWDAEKLAKAVETFLPNSQTLLKYLGKQSSAMEVEASVKEALPEVFVYLALLVTIFLLDKNELEKGFQLSQETVAYVQKVNRRTMDPLAAHVYFYFARFHELMGKLDECRSVLLLAHRTATLRRDEESQASLLNLLLRNYLHYNLIESADKLVEKTSLPENASNNQTARYMYYTGRVKAINLEYSDARRHLLQAIRKAPQNVTSAGFQQTVNKLFVVVELLMGEIPERSIFRQQTLRKPLIPYFHITQAVRTGDLNKFQETLKNFGVQFKQDKTLTLILRLRHNVIKTGIKMISLSYSRISLKDICLKLGLDSEEDAEFIVAKAIRDGVIDATLVHEHGYMKSKENVDIYSSSEPQNAFDQRISFCLQLHQESVKALRFPNKPQMTDVEALNEMRELEREISEIAANEDEMDEGDDLGF